MGSLPFAFNHWDICGNGGKDVVCLCVRASHTSEAELDLHSSEPYGGVSCGECVQLEVAHGFCDLVGGIGVVGG